MVRDAEGRIATGITLRDPKGDLEATRQLAGHAASILAGLGASHSLAETIRPRVATRVNALLASKHGLPLGHALELANILQQAEMGRDSERCARRALKILKDRSPRGHDASGPVARALLAGALAQQKRWWEILKFEPEGNLIVVSPHARALENMRALALMELGRLTESEETLRRVLDADASNATALVLQRRL
jgi:hypothetical protein